MKRFKIITAVFLAAAAFICAPEARALSGMGLNGATGLYSVPTGRIAWQSSDFALDFGYHAIMNSSEAAHIPKMSMSLFNWVELSAAFDIQPADYAGVHEDGSDFLGGLKVQFPVRNTAFAVGGNFQVLNMGSELMNYNAGQIYLAVTYAGHFFNMPAETSIFFGKTFIEDRTDSSIDFGMGFDLMLLPSVFNNFVHWILDFSNSSYSVEAFGASAVVRGVFNTGLRIDLSTIPALSKFKFVIDAVITDALDSHRAFSAGLLFGVPVL